MQFDNPPPNRPKNDMEGQQKPEKLYRGFVVPVEDLSLELLQKPLSMGQSAGSGENEAGIYMSTNLSMVEQTDYSNTSLTSIPVPKHNSGYGIKSQINLPGCGVIVEVETKDLLVRKPKIAPVWQGHYNNGFQGEEWIADSIPTSSFRVTKLTLSRGATDPERFFVKINENTSEDLDAAIKEIKNKYEIKKQEAMKYKDFLETMPEDDRFNEFKLKRKWAEFKNLT